MCAFCFFLVVLVARSGLYYSVVDEFLTLPLKERKKERKVTGKTGVLSVLDQFTLKIYTSSTNTSN